MAIESKMPTNRAPLAPRPSFGQSVEPPVSPKKQKSFKWLWVTIVIVLVIGGIWVKMQSPKQDVLSELQGVSKPLDIATGQYQAVFLDNRQTYFGKLDPKGGDFLILTDVFYLQAQTATSAGNVSLSKLGSEAHAPEDKMSINKSHVLFIENLKSDSKVVQAIQQYKSK
ncbi:MAG: hypothetical protein AAB664_03475 [Patescibacteria group bacterium]